MSPSLPKRLYKLTAVAAVTMSFYAHAQDVPIVQPGAPGQNARALSAEEAIQITNTSHTQDDVVFMQNMIPHHSQAVEMGVLVEQRTNNEDIVDIAGRIKKSQDDEITFMTEWLEQRGETTEMHHHDHMDHAMMGMATAEQMAELAASQGTDFDRLFLTLMIPHHEGAVKMVEDLLEQDGSAYDPVLYEFVNDIVNDQNAEITRMNDLLAGLANDPRSSLAAGFRNAGEASLNLNLLASLPKPRGFFDPENPSNLPPIVPKDEEEAEEDLSRDELDGGDVKTEWGSVGHC